MPPILQLFRTADARLRGPEATAWLARLEPEQDNLRAALQWTLDEGRYADMAWLLLAVAWFWFHTGRWQESARWIAQLLPHREALDADVRLAILINLYRVSRASEEFQPIDRYTDEMMGLLEVCPDKAHACGGLVSLSRPILPVLPRPAPRGSGRSRAPAPPVKSRGWVPNSAS